MSAAAAKAWPANVQPFHFDVELRVAQYSERRLADRDNLIKPIQDVLQSIAYLDDRQVKDSTSNWRDINGKFTIRFASLLLALAFVDGQSFLHVRLWASPDIEDLG